MPLNNPWTIPEREQLEKYFRTNITKMTLYQRLNKLNSLRSFEAVTRELRRMKRKGWTRTKHDALNKLRVGYLDIEATDLQADFGFMLTWYIKKRGKNEYDFSIITKKEIFDGDFDRRLVSEFFDALDNYDVLYTHYGGDRRFDVPFIRTRAYAHGLQKRLPGHLDKFIMDTWPTARNKLRLHRNSLESIAFALGIRGVKKTPLEPHRWQRAAIGDEKALEYIALHNKRDVQLLERVHKKYEEGHIEKKIYRSM